MKPASIIPFSIQRMVCTGCGAETNASCNCGKPYIPAKERIAKYDKENPGQSTRQAAADLGMHHSTVAEARSGVGKPTGDTITGRDGKEYPARAASRETKMGIANLRNVFLINCAASIKAVQYDGPVDDEIRAAARRVADAWSNLADEMEKSK